MAPRLMPSLNSPRPTATPSLTHAAWIGLSSKLIVDRTDERAAMIKYGMVHLDGSGADEMRIGHAEPVATTCPAPILVAH